MALTLPTRRVSEGNVTEKSLPLSLADASGWLIVQLHPNDFADCRFAAGDGAFEPYVDLLTIPGSQDAIEGQQ